MSQQTEQIANRLGEIEQELRTRYAERASLLRIKRSADKWPHLLKEGDQLSQRNIYRFEMLARIAEYLDTTEPKYYGGSSTKEVYKEVLQAAEEEFEKYRNQTFGIKKFEINYNTFRSYLSKFGDEGRIYFDHTRRRWRISEIDESIPGEFPREDEADRS